MSAAARAALALAGLILWTLVFGLPLAALCAAAYEASGFPRDTLALAPGTVLRAAALAALAVILGAIPGKIFATLRHGRIACFFLLVFPLLLPRYVLYYVWTMPLSPTTPLGDMLGVQLRKEALLTPIQATAALKKIGVDETVMSGYHVSTSGALKLAQTDSNVTRRVFGAHKEQ